MRSHLITYPVAILLMIAVPFMRYYSSTPGINACVLDYVDNIEESNYGGYLYNINGQRHIEPKNSEIVDSVQQYKVGEAYGCLMVSDNLFIDLTNTFYCTVVYLIKKAPISNNLKTPLGINKLGTIEK
ncbi:MAG: hypothetical protein PHV23_01350 [Candidatus Gracilibacteria bacterium]|nr:hypothetical protein [Candidatus Gracilibacteria bacterium]